VHQQATTSRDEENDAKDEKSIVKLMKSTLPQLSNEADWEISIFELSLILDRIWPHKDELDILDYMTSEFHRRSPSGDMEERADRLIYFALTMCAKKDSYAKLQIVAASHKDAEPCVLQNEGKKLYQMFQAMFTMTNLHQASLPTVRAEFYAISQRENESILKYTARVDLIVATMAKLGERISTGAWIYALGNGLRPEFKDSKDGILYSKDGYHTVLKVKIKLQSEEAVLLAKKARSPPIASDSIKGDEIAFATVTKKDKKTIKPSTKLDADSVALPDPRDTALLITGKGGKPHSKGKGHPKGKQRWSPPDSPPDLPWDRTWPPVGDNVATWPQSPKGKGRGNGRSSKGIDTQTLWCDIHQKFGHSTDWCYDNPHRTGGPPPYTDGPWCESCNRYGHTANSCYASTVRIVPKGKGKSPYRSGKGKSGDRGWKSHNFPAGYQSDQATPALHEEISSTAASEWWNDYEFGSAVLESDVDPPVPLQTYLQDDYVELNQFDDDDDESISDYIDLVLYAIIKNIERQTAYRLNPTDALLLEIREHSLSITLAENCLNIHIQRIIKNFKTTINYDALMSELNTPVVEISSNSTESEITKNDVCQNSSSVLLP
jgi:hypothetical protein